MCQIETVRRYWLPSDAQPAPSRHLFGLRWNTGLWKYMFAITSSKKTLSVFGSMWGKVRLRRQPWVPSSLTSNLGCFGQVTQSLCPPVSLCVKVPSQKGFVKMESEKIAGYLAYCRCSRNSPLNHLLQGQPRCRCLLLFLFRSIFLFLE